MVNEWIAAFVAPQTGANIGDASIGGTNASPEEINIDI